jgi:hypothetical protein
MRVRELMGPAGSALGRHADSTHLFIAPTVSWTIQSALLASHTPTPFSTRFSMTRSHPANCGADRILGWHCRLGRCAQRIRRSRFSRANCPRRKGRRGPNRQTGGFELLPPYYSTISLQRPDPNAASAKSWCICPCTLLL